MDFEQFLQLDLEEAGEAGEEEEEGVFSVDAFEHDPHLEPTIAT